MSEQEIKVEEVKTRGRRTTVAQPVVDKVAKAINTPYSDEIKSNRKKEEYKIREQVILIQTPKGTMNKKTYGIFGVKNGNAKYKRLLKIEKNVKNIKG